MSGTSCVWLTRHPVGHAQPLYRNACSFALQLEFRGRRGAGTACGDRLASAQRPGTANFGRCDSAK
eukprot:12096792-Alexandrium_andersonii.AAC.1